MFELENGRKHFYQWDTGQRLIISDATVIEAHFCNRTDECSLTCEVYTDGGKRVVDVPNILLQDNWDIRVYAFCGNYTKVEERFEVVKRSKPADYAYTETEVKSWEALNDRANAALDVVEEVAAAETERKEAETARQETAAEMEQATAKAEAATNAANVAIETLMNNAHAPAIMAENTGAVVAVDDAAATLSVGATSHIVATQAGEGRAAPDNVRTISGCDTAKIIRCTNLLDVETITYPTVYINGNKFGNIASGRTITMECEPNTSYTVTKSLPSTLRIATSTEYPQPNATSTVYKTGNAQTTTLIITSGANDKYLTIQLYATGDTYGDTETHLQTLRVYKTNEAQTLTATLPETVYGGTLDFATGLLTVTHKREAITRMSATHSNAGEGYLAASIGKTDMKSNGRDNGLCETMLPVLTHVGATTNCIVFGANNQTLYIAISKELAGSTRDSLNAYLAANPLIVVYELAEPYTIQLTAQQLELYKGNNTVWSTTGDTTLAYIADTKLYIDGKFAELQNAIVSLGSNV